MVLEPRGSPEGALLFPKPILSRTSRASCGNCSEAASSLGWPSPGASRRFSLVYSSHPLSSSNIIADTCFPASAQGGSVRICRINRPGPVVPLANLQGHGPHYIIYVTLIISNSGSACNRPLNSPSTMVPCRRTKLIAYQAAGCENNVHREAARRPGTHRPH